MPIKKSSRREPAAAGGGELVFVLDITSFTKGGYIGTTVYEGRRLEIEFDDGDDGFSLLPSMARRLGVRKGSLVSAVVENGPAALVRMRVSAVGSDVRISNPKMYYSVGREGGAVVRIGAG